MRSIGRVLDSAYLRDSPIMLPNRSVKESLMHHAKLMLISSLMLTMLVGTFLMSSIAQAHVRTAAPNITCGKWNLVNSPSPDRYGDNFTAVAAISASDVWAVGEELNGSNNPVLSEHYNGTQWSVVSMPDPGGSLLGRLFSLTAISTSDVWAVGIYTDINAVDHTLIEQWNGSAWSIIPSPNEGTRGSDLYSIAAVSATDIWAVGIYKTSTIYSSTLVEQWNGTSWNIVASPNGAGLSSGLSGVSAVSSNAIWAVGSTGSSTSATLVEKWNGTAWKVVKSPNRTGTDDNLNAVVAISSTDIWTDGSSYNSSTGKTSTLIEQWNGSKWKIVNSPTPSTASQLFSGGIAAVSSSNVWTVGYYQDTQNFNRALIEHWNGTSWSLVAGSKAGSLQNELYGIAVVPGTSTLWSVGLLYRNSVSQTLTEYYC